jgi:hypothetical protein
LNGFTPPKLEEIGIQCRSKYTPRQILISLRALCKNPLKSFIVRKLDRKRL